MRSSLKKLVVLLSAGTLFSMASLHVLAQDKLVAKNTPPTPSALEQLLNTSAPLPRGPVHEAFAQPVKLTAKPGAVVQERPPAAVKEIPNENRPGGNDVTWIDGYWSWNDRAEKYVWVSGLWRKSPPGRRWEPGTWVKLVDGYIWVAGEWMPEEAKEKLATVVLPPDSLETGPNQPRPEEETFWLPGNWEQVEEKKNVATKTEVAAPIADATTTETAATVATTTATADATATTAAATATDEAQNFSLIKAAPTEAEQNGYSWRPGFWTVARDNWVWVPDHYTWTPDGTRVVEGYWDYPWSVRGNLNACCGQPTETYAPTSIDTSDRFTQLWTHADSGHYYYGNYYEQDPGNLVPWHQYHLQNTGYDPLYSYYSGTFGPKVGQDFGTYLNSRYAYNQQVYCPTCETSIVGGGGAGRTARPIARAAVVAAPIATAAAIAGGGGSSVAAATGAATSAATGGAASAATTATGATSAAATGAGTTAGAAPGADATSASDAADASASSESAAATDSAAESATSAADATNPAEAAANQAQEAAGDLQSNLPGEGGDAAGADAAGGDAAGGDGAGGDAAGGADAGGGGDAAGGADAGAGGGGDAPAAPGGE